MHTTIHVDIILPSIHPSYSHPLFDYKLRRRRGPCFSIAAAAMAMALPKLASLLARSTPYATNNFAVRASLHATAWRAQATASEENSPAVHGVAMVQGASRGIGLEFVSFYCSKKALLEILDSLLSRMYL